MKNDIFESEFAKGFINLCEMGWQKGWHERNGGNLSYRIKKEEIAPYLDSLCRTGEICEIGVTLPRLAGEFFMVTGSGKYMSKVKGDPENCLAVIEILPDGGHFRTVAGLSAGGRPTSELPTHLMGHDARMSATDGSRRVIYHCHPANLIAMTFLLPLEDRAFSKELWEMMTECPIIFPAGVGVVKWMVPGGAEIARASVEKMKTFDAVVWAHHGIFCAGDDFDNTFGLCHTVEKAAEIWIKVRSVADRKRQTITKDEFVGLAKAFGVELNTDFLD